MPLAWGYSTQCVERRRKDRPTVSRPLGGFQSLFRRVRQTFHQEQAYIAGFPLGPAMSAARAQQTLRGVSASHSPAELSWRQRLVIHSEQISVAVIDELALCVATIDVGTPAEAFDMNAANALGRVLR